MARLHRLERLRGLNSNRWHCLANLQIGAKIMAKKIELAPFKIVTRKGWIWIENSETGTRGPKFEARSVNRRALRSRQARLNSRVALDRLGIF